MLVGFLRRIASGLVVVFVLIACCELVLTTIGYTRPLETLPPIVLWNQKNDSKIRDGQAMFRFDRRLFWALQPGAVIEGAKGEMINPAGFRGRMLDVDRAPGTFRVACLGDSTTFGVFMPGDQTYVSRLPDELAKRWPARGEPVEIEALNAGVIGYSAFQGHELLRMKVLDYRPDVVTLMFGAMNDGLRAKGLGDRAKSQALLYPGASRRIYHFLTRYRFVQLLSALVSRIEDGAALSADGDRIRNETDEPRVPVSEFSTLVLAMVESAQHAGAKVVLLGPPRTEALRRQHPGLPDYSASLARIAHVRGIPYLDFEPIFDADPSLFHDMVHPSAAGHALIACRIADLIAEQTVERSK